MKQRIKEFTLVLVIGEGLFLALFMIISSVIH